MDEFDVNQVVRVIPTEDEPSPEQVEERTNPATFFEDQAACAWEMLIKLSDPVINYADDPDGYSDSLARLSGQLELFLGGGLSSGDRVEVLVSGTGKTFPKGMNRRTGRVLKSGHTEYALLVELDEPLLEELVINISPLHLRRLD